METTEIKNYLKELEELNYANRLILESIGNILYSIRGDFSGIVDMKARIKASLILLDTLPNNEYVRELEKTIKGFEPGKTDGRYFRDNFPYGYIGILPGEYGELEHD